MFASAMRRAAFSNVKIFNTTKRWNTQGVSSILDPLVSDVLKRSNHGKIYQTLSAVPEDRIPLSKFEAICAENNEQAASVSSSLAESGLLMAFTPENAKKSAAVAALLSRFPELEGQVHLRPQKLAESLLQSLGVTGHCNVKQLQQKLAALKEEIAPLEKQMSAIDAAAWRSADVKFWGWISSLLVQFGVFARLTWVDLSWDVMEPIMSFYAFGGTILTYMYFAMTKTEFTSDGLRSRFFAKKQAKLIKRQNFDIESYYKLQKAIKNTTSQLVDSESS